MMFQNGIIPDCTLTEFRYFHDSRGWLAEIFRSDELSATELPAMGYLSFTEAGVSRGPHEHVQQSDLFVFFDGTFKVWLWDMRPDSATFQSKQVEILGTERRGILIVPPGVVHAYQNIGENGALIFNCPNQLYGGKNRKEPVDEIRHELLAESPFLLD